MDEFDDCDPMEYDDLKELGDREAFEDAQADMRENYENGECPDCGEEIPDDMPEGGECANCGHVFHLPQEDDDCESDYENDTPMGQAYGDGFED
jgi:DNA-directed RNA polymerase subunit RPC12/RpoP